MSDPDFILGLAGFQVSRLLQDGPEVSALQALSFPHSHDFSEGPPPAELIREVRQLRCPLGVCFVSFLLCVLSQACCAVDGWNLYGAGPDVPTHCRPLKYWLSAYLASTLLPLTTSMALALPLGVLAMATGTLVRALTPASCKNEAASLWQFVDEVGAKGLVCLAGLLIIAGLCAATIFPAIRAIDARWGASGSAVTEVIEAIREDQPPEVSPETECAICLGSDGALLGAWRELPCSHRFHEDCLLEWVGRKLRCPLCRLDLHSAYARRSRQAPLLDVGEV
eukprot:s5158_g3.t1